jgi:hypothetical protein
MRRLKTPWRRTSTADLFLKAAILAGFFSAGFFLVTMKLTIVVPIYNERELAPQALARIEAAPLPAGLSREVVLIDDCSTDGTREWLQE